MPGRNASAHTIPAKRRRSRTPFVVPLTSIPTLEQAEHSAKRHLAAPPGAAAFQCHPCAVKWRQSLEWSTV